MGQRLSLDADVRFVPGVGPARADEFAVLGIRTVGDLIEHFPFRHETIPKSVGIGELALDETATIVGEIGRVRLRGRSGAASSPRRWSTGRGDAHVDGFIHNICWKNFTSGKSFASPDESSFSGKTRR
ncbi:MAG: hypothetical protein IIC02_04005 [Planctomycetes bacterium]|nr:hypothetical protein [Planctomycetota bacterium]